TRNMAKARWMARASVALKTPTRSWNGSGEAYQSWNSDHRSGTTKSTIWAALLRGWRPPVSASATFLDSSSAFGAACAVEPVAVVFVIVGFRCYGLHV